MVLVALLVSGTAAVSGDADGEKRAHAECRLEPRVLDVSRPAGRLTVRLELSSRDGLSARDPADLRAGVHVSRVAGFRLPAPSEDGEGIDEEIGLRTLADAVDVGTGLQAPNGRQEAVVVFARPCDGDPATRDDGDAGDVLAMLLDVPDGESAEVCVAGFVGDDAFECCDAIQVRNRGLRDLPRGLFPDQEPRQ